MSAAETLPAGWAFPPSSRKAHYFPEGESTSLADGQATPIHRLRRTVTP